MTQSLVSCVKIVTVLKIWHDSRCGPRRLFKISALTDLAEFVGSVSVIDLASREASVLPAGECGFAYRQSRFQTEPNLLVTGLCGQAETPTLN